MGEAVKIDLWRDHDLGGLNCALWDVGKYEFERHIHDELVIAVTEMGFASCSTNGLAGQSRPGSIWVSGVGEYHSGRVEGKQWRYRAIYLDETALSSISDVFYSPGRNVSIPPGVYFDPQLANLLVNAHRLIEENAPLLERETHWWSAMGLFLGRYGRPISNRHSSFTEKNRTSLVREYLHVNFNTDVSSHALSELTGMSRYYLIRAFKREHGLPPHAYQNQIRLNHARRLLEEGTPPALVATAVGFYDQSHLNRLFKKTYNLTPGQYARSTRHST